MTIFRVPDDFPLIALALASPLVQQGDIILVREGAGQEIAVVPDDKPGIRIVADGDDVGMDALDGTLAPVAAAEGATSVRLATADSISAAGPGDGGEPDVATGPPDGDGPGTSGLEPAEADLDAPDRPENGDGATSAASADSTVDDTPAAVPGTGDGIDEAVPQPADDGPADDGGEPDVATGPPDGDGPGKSGPEPAEAELDTPDRPENGDGAISAAGADSTVDDTPAAVPGAGDGIDEAVHRPADDGPGDGGEPDVATGSPDGDGPGKSGPEPAEAELDTPDRPENGDGAISAAGADSTVDDTPAAVPGAGDGGDEAVHRPADDGPADDGGEPDVATGSPDGDGPEPAEADLAAPDQPENGDGATSEASANGSGGSEQDGLPEIPAAPPAQSVAEPGQVRETRLVDGPKVVLVSRSGGKMIRIVKGSGSPTCLVVCRHR